MELPMSSVDQTPVLMGNMAGQVFLDHIKENSSGVSIEKKVVFSPENYYQKIFEKKVISFRKNKKRPQNLFMRSFFIIQ